MTLLAMPIRSASSFGACAPAPRVSVSTAGNASAARRVNAGPRRPADAAVPSPCVMFASEGCGAFPALASILVDVVAEGLAAVSLAHRAATLQGRDHAVHDIVDVGRQERLADHEAVRAG